MLSEYQLSLTPVNTEQAEPLARSRLEAAQKNLGFVPNMYAGMANSPGLLDTYVQGYDNFRSHSGFSSVEQEVILLAISHENGCGYCVAAHSFIADQMSGVPHAVTDAIRAGQPIADAKLAALHDFSKILVRSRGLPSRAQVEDFLAAGYTEQQILDIVLAIAVKTLSNYSNHLLHTQLDPLFAGRAW